MCILVVRGPAVLAVGAGGPVFISAIMSLFFLPLSGRRLDLDRNTDSKGYSTRNNQPTPI